MTNERISLLIALLAVVVNPLVSYLVVKMQVTASVVSSNRQVWINSLREKISEYLSLIYGVMGSTNFSINDAERFGMIEKISRLGFHIELMLNKNEDGHKLLKGYLNNAMLALAQKDLNALSEASKKIHDITSTILKLEWERVKKAK